MLARPKLGDGRPCLPDRPRTTVAAASKDHVGTGAPARPVERSSTSGANCRCRVRSFAPPGGRGRPPLRGRADPVRLCIRFMTAEFGRLAPQTALSRAGITLVAAFVESASPATWRVFGKAFREVGR